MARRMVLEDHRGVLHMASDVGRMNFGRRPQMLGGRRWDGPLRPPSIQCAKSLGRRTLPIAPLGRISRQCPHRTFPPKGDTSAKGRCVVR